MIAGIPAHLVAASVLVIGAVVALLLISMLSTNSILASVVGAIFAIVALLVGAFGPQPSLAVVGICAIALLALLVLPVLQTAVPAHVAEVSALLLLGSAGGIALAGATDLLQAVIGLETLALSAVILVALGRGDRCLEASFKYFVLGAISLAGLLYGVGLVYLGTGSFGFPTADQVSANPLTLAGVVLVVLGLCFELAVFPLHWGALDAYTAAAASVAGFVMSASKLAAAYALGRVVLSAGAPAAPLLVWIGCLTIIWGTFGALAHGRTLRRMLAYSAITHAGFIGLALGCLPNGPNTAVFYAGLYASMAMLVFAALAGTGAEPELRTMGRGRALALALGLFALSGIPPTPGFWAKLAVLVVAWQSAGPLPTLIAAAGGVFSVLYYLRPVPDLLAALRAEGATPRVVLPGVVLATILVVIVSLAPGIAWTLAR
ncbi:MAG: hypothetical protein JOZ81_20825 [Chloroflexi bacterium]|nr:hypothetical protein [Chloroflexota bacterium]